MKEYEITAISGASSVESSEAYEKVCSYLLKKFCEDCELNEGIGIFEGIDRRSGGKGLLNTGTKEGMRG